MDMVAGPILEALNKILQTIKSITDDRVKRRDARQDQHWENLATQLTVIKSLVPQHLDAIKIVRNSLTDHRDLKTAADALRKLVENDDLPLGYDLARGTVKQLANMKAFSESARDLMNEMLGRLRDFQVAAFIIDPRTEVRLNSFEILAAFENAVTLLSLIEKQQKTPEDIKLIVGLGSHVRQQLGQIEVGLLDPSSQTPFETTDEVVKLATAWCNSWLEKVRAPLVSGKGVMATIGALEAQRPAG